MTNSQLCTFIQQRLRRGREVLISLRPWLAEARRRYSQPGRRVPVPGRPSFTEWIHLHTGYSDRYIRMILSDAEPYTRRPRKRVDRNVRFKLLANAAVDLAQLVARSDAQAHGLAFEILKIADEGGLLDFRK
jgi:hypothetical protein